MTGTAPTDSAPQNASFHVTETSVGTNFVFTNVIDRLSCSYQPKNIQGHLANF